MASELLYISGSWVCPARVFSVQVECWGAGGSTDGGYLGGLPCGGAGGGAYAKKTVPVTPGVSYSYVVADGVNTLDTYWVNASTVMAKGGGYCTDFSGAPGGDASQCVGDVRYSGGSGGDATQQGEFEIIDTPGGGGGGAGSNGNGGHACEYMGGSGTAEYGGNGGSVDEPAGLPYGGGACGRYEDIEYGCQGLIRITYEVTPINDHSFQASSRGMFCGTFRKMR